MTHCPLGDAITRELREHEKTCPACAAVVAAARMTPVQELAYVIRSQASQMRMLIEFLNAPKGEILDTIKAATLRCAISALKVAEEHDPHERTSQPPGT